MSDPIDVVRRFCEAWTGGTADSLSEWFTDDAVYHNIPLDPVNGPQAIRDTIAGFLGPFSVEFRVLHIAADGDVVMTERVDVFDGGGKHIELPVMGAFEVEGDKLRAWRDYFDLNQFMSQVSA